jgi:hypothetical protein
MLEFVPLVVTLMIVISLIILIILIALGTLITLIALTTFVTLRACQLIDIDSYLVELRVSIPVLKQASLSLSRASSLLGLLD